MKIGIVNDLPMAVEALRRALASRVDFEVVWSAGTGAEALMLAAKQKPDLVLMDLLLPDMDGVETTRRLMAETPCAVLIVTASVGANAWRVFEAMGQGALDAVDIPALGASDPRASAAPLLAKIDIIARLIGVKRSRDGGRADTPLPASRDRLLAMGASAGGPAALAEILGGLPADFPASVVIVQHIDAQFAPGMASWLAQKCPLPVRTAVEGDRPAPGVVLLASTSDHLVFKAASHLGYSTAPADVFYRPSVDAFFHSLNRFWQGTAVGVLLTGMGRDGADGLKALRNNGHPTIAQDERTSAVYGMPKAAAEIDAALEILPLESIAPRLVQLFPPPAPRGLAS